MCFTFGTKTVTFQCGNGWNMLLLRINLLKLTLLITMHSYLTLQNISKLLVWRSDSLELSWSLYFLGRYLNASPIQTKIQINPHYLSANITIFCDSEPKVLLIKQTSRLEITQKISLINAFGTLRSKRKSFVRVHKLLCHVNLTNILHNDFSNHGQWII